MKIKNVNKIVAYGFIFIILLMAQSYAGGDVGNGGGGDVQVDHSWKFFEGWGKYISDLTSPSYRHALESYQSENPEHKIIFCSDSKNALGFPALVDELKDKVSFKIWDMPNVFKRFFGSQPKKRSWRLKRLCENEKRVEAYGHLIMTLNDMAKRDEVGTYLLNTIVQKGSPVTFIISDQRQNIKAKGGEIEEFTWFDHETGEIFWAPREEQRGAVLIIGRTLLSFLRHELTHVLIYRSLTHYPKVEYWHDISQETKDQYALFKTSAEAAFIEGLAFAMEGGTVLDHPRIADSRLNRLHFDRDRNQYSYYLDAVKIEAGKARVPVESEIYLASVFNDLFRGYRPMDKDEVTIEFNKYGFVYIVTNKRMMCQVIDVISKLAPSDVSKFAIGLDTLMGQDIGNRWLREFFFQDYTSSKNVLDYFEYSVDQRPKEIILDPSKRDLFFSPYLADRRELIRKEAEEIFARKYEPILLQDEIQRIVEEENARLNKAETKVMTLAEAARRREELQHSLFDSVTSRDLHWDLRWTIYDRVKAEYGIIIYGSDISDYMKQQILFPAPFQKDIDERQRILGALEILKNAETTVGMPEHVTRALSVREAIGELQKNTDILIGFILLTDVFSEFQKKAAEEISK